MIKIPLLQRLSRYKKWVGSGGISNHSPIYLEILGPDAKPKAPFKFNHVWLQDEGYTCLVKDFWTSHPITNHRSTTEGFCHNLSQLKQLTMAWAKEKAKDEQLITTIEAELKKDDINLGFTSVEEKAKLIELEKQKDKILKEREESWRLNSRAIWLKAGDENTKFYQNFSKGRKTANTIWKIPLPNGEQANNFQKLSRLGTSHFRNLFRSP